MNQIKRSVFFLSDGTGITAEILGNTLLTQFESINFKTRTLPFIDTVDKAKEAVLAINQVAATDAQPPIVFDTIVEPEIREIITQCDGLLIDFFRAFLAPMEDALGVKASSSVGKSHSAANPSAYNARIEAINYALASDDGNGVQNYDKADIILIGVSRSGKTPTSLYLAIQYGIRAANYPFTEHDINDLKLPKAIRPYKRKCFCLSIDPKTLHGIRTQRRADSHYASMRQCKIEVAEIEELCRREGIKILESTHRSIEELASKIISETKLKRNIY